MKIEVISRDEKSVKECDYSDAFQIKINAKIVFSVSDGEPEDSNLNRDFNDVYNIPELLKLAYDAGKAGEPFEINYSESSEI